MIVVDSSVWIDFFNGAPSQAKEALKRLLARGEAEIVVPDLVLFEVLRGFRLEREFRQAQLLMGGLTVQTLCNAELAAQAAQHYRSMRAAGFTIRSPIDTLLGAFCMAHDHVLLHADRDFDVMENLLGLRTWKY